MCPVWMAGTLTRRALLNGQTQSTIRLAVTEIDFIDACLQLCGCGCSAGEKLFTERGHDQRQTIHLLLKLIQLMLLAIRLGFHAFRTDLCGVCPRASFTDLPTLAQIPQKSHDLVPRKRIHGTTFRERCESSGGSRGERFQHQPSHTFPRLDVGQKRQAVDGRLVLSGDAIHGQTGLHQLLQALFF